MVLNLTNLLDLPDVVVDSWDCQGHSVSFNLNLLAKGMYCPHCNTYTEEFQQVRPIIVRDLPACGKEVGVA